MKKKCKCDYCGASPEKIKALESQEDKWLKTDGFYIHLVIDADPANAHTHGLVENFNHLDIQIAYPLPAKLMMILMHTIVDKIKAGDKIKDGDLLDYVLDNYNVKAIQMTEMGRPVMRILLPDVTGKFPDEEECDPKYKIQMKSEDLTCLKN